MASQKFYNPYPFPVRVLNDLGDIYVLAPQDYCKIMNGEYTQSALELLPLKNDRIYKKGLDVDIHSLVKAELLKVAFALCIDEVDDRTTKPNIIKAIMDAVGEI